jgi:aminopeptidase N
MHRDAAPKAIRRLDYLAPTFWIDRVALVIELNPRATEVTTTLHFQRNVSHASDAPLTLDGEKINLLEVRLDGHTLPPERYSVADDQLTVRGLPQAGALTVRSTCNPQDNDSLEGLYLSNGTFCTQCEAEGFRRIAFYPDRPDVMAVFHVTLRADKQAYPVLLSNGNLLSSRALPDGRHEAIWEDPFKKPCYLFALVAGDVGKITDQFVTQSGRKVLLEIYAKPHNLEQCHFAMEALKKSMRWDEQVYGREYDLDRFMIYSADDFNFGAMENKGLNIFNSSALLAKPETASDTDFARIEGVVAHEYFHNWSGNRVTCRDWFQLSLKEGFTVLRDQQFSADMGSAAVNRVEAVQFLRQHQFAEDGGPLAHPVRPDEYITIDNFYTLTIYEKGAEVIRMMHTLLGAETFRKGSDLYFANNDGTAATCDDFVAAMEQASGRDLTQFKRWYSQAGTPRVRVQEKFDAAAERYAVTLTQSLAATPGQASKQAMVIPIALGLLDAKGNETHATRVVELSTTEQTITFDRIAAQPVLSLVRGFSAPIHLEVSRSLETLALLARYDTDAVARWDAMVSLMQRVCASVLAGEAIPAVFDATFDALLRDTVSDPALIAMMISLPVASEIADAQTQAYDPAHIAGVLDQLGAHVVGHHARRLDEVYARTRAVAAYAFTPAETARRSLHATALELHCATGDAEAIARAAEQFKNCDNMTDQMAALRALNGTPGAQRDAALAAFYARFQDEPLVVNKWFAVQAESEHGGTLASVQALMQHRKFDGRNPNKMRAVLGSFALRNWRHFHAPDGSGYAFVADQIIAVDRTNPNLSARFVNAFDRWQRCTPAARDAQRAALERIKATTGVSDNVLELVSKTLG